MAKGPRNDKCDLHFLKLWALRCNKQTRRSNIEQQLRTRTSLSPAQRGAALLHLFGLALSSALGSGSRWAFFPEPALGIQKVG